MTRRSADALRKCDCDQAGGELGDVLQVDRAPALRRSSATAGDQPTEPPVRGPIGREQHEWGGVDGRDFGPDQQVQVVLFRGQMSPDHAGQGVAVGDGQGTVAELGRLGDQLLRV